VSDHPEADMLVDGAWLEAHLNDPNLRIVDCGSRDAYLRAHIPGAVFPADANFKDTTPERSRFVMPPEQFAQAMAALGIGDETAVVAYDAAQVTAGRLWWCLQYYGHSNVRILDGGWNQWLQDKRPIAMGDARDGGSAAATAGPFTAVPHPEMYATAEHVMEILNNPNAIVLDVRSDGEWNGTVTRGNKRQGHMPGNAVHLEWTNYLTPDAGKRWKSGNELKAMFEAIGVTPDKEVVTVCQGGIRAAQAAFTLKLLGYKNVRNYDGSFGEWGNRDDTPIIT
jgi:thiosulfate/3-mercaptopyruvate sulfurtransferase